MREDIRKARVKKYGSFLYCPQGDCLCVCLNNEYGTCKRAVCLHDDPEWLQLQERIEKNRKRAATSGVNIPEKPQENIRMQTGQAALKERIRQKEELSERLYRENKPQLAETVFRQAQIMKGELRK